MALLVGLFALAAVVVYLMARPSSHPGTGSGSATISANSLGAGSTSPSNPQPASPEPVKDVRQLVASLSELDVSTASITASQAAQWRQAFQKLVQQGAAATPAIGEFLSRNVDVDLDQIQGGEALGYGTVRLALLEALRQIGGAESITTALQVLKATADPKEIAMLARNLEQQAPGQHRAVFLAAAREALGQANRGQLEGHDMGPLFEVLQRYGGVNVASDLEQVASKWNFYSMIALGGLADGAGIPALTRVAQDSSIPNVMALRVLAQLAGAYPQAKSALLDQVRSNKMPFSAWSGIQSALSGELIDYATPILGPVIGPVNGPNSRTYHINYGNQNYRTTTVSAEWSEAQIKQQLAIIDEVIAADANLETLQFLQDARLSLAGRLSK